MPFYGKVPQSAVDPTEPLPFEPIMLEMTAATAEQEMWGRRFKVLYAQHPIWRSADKDGCWGLRDFLRYAGEVCGFDPDEPSK